MIGTVLNDVITAAGGTINPSDELKGGDGFDELILTGSFEYDLSTIAAFSGIERITHEARFQNTTITLPSSGDFELIGLGSISSVEEAWVLNGSNATINGGNGWNSYYTGSGTSQITGGDHSDRLAAGSGAVIATLGGATDAFYVGTGAAIVDLGSGDDIIWYTGDSLWTMNTFVDGNVGSADRLDVAVNANFTEGNLTNVEILNCRASDTTIIVDDDFLYSFTLLTDDSFNSASNTNQIVSTNDTHLGLTHLAIINWDKITTENTNGTTFEVSGAATAQLVHGNTGNDTLIVSATLSEAQRTQIFSQSIETITDLSGTYTVLGGPVAGTPADDTLTGSAGADQFTGAGGNDTIHGLGGADTYYHSGTAADGDDVVDTGDDGIDRVVFTTPDLFDINYQRDGNDLVLGGYNPDTDDFDGRVRVVNHYAGSSVAYVLIDTVDYNLLYGPDANLAKLYFTTDLTSGLNQADGAEFLLGTGNGEVINGNGGYYDALWGFGGDDTLNAGNGDTWLRGGTGSDTLNGAEGDDRLRGDQGDDVIDGGAGFDRVRYNNASDGVLVDLVDGTAVDLFGTSNSGSDTIINVEGIEGSNFLDLLHGNSDGNLLWGLDGDDALYGREGDDTLQGGGGNDSISGDAGQDLYLHSGTAADGDDLVFLADDGLDTVRLTESDIFDLYYVRDGNDLIIGGRNPDTGEFDGSLKIIGHYAGSSIAYVQFDSLDYNNFYGVNEDLATIHFTSDPANGIDNVNDGEIILGADWSRDDQRQWWLLRRPLWGRRRRHHQWRRRLRQHPRR